MDFVSFLLENGMEFESAIVYGKAIEDEFDFDSKIDLLLKTDEKGEANAKKLRKLYYKIHGERWAAKGMIELINLKFNMEDAKKGIILYQNFEGSQEPKEAEALFALDFTNLDRSSKLSVWRKLYGYSQNVNGKIYSSKGMIEELGGQKLEKGVVKVPQEKEAELERFLKKEGVDFRVSKVWGAKR